MTLISITTRPYGGGFYTYASKIVNGSTIVPPGGYFAFSWRNPEESHLWSLGGGQTDHDSDKAVSHRHADLSAQGRSGRRSEL